MMRALLALGLATVASALHANMPAERGVPHRWTAAHHEGPLRVRMMAGKSRRAERRAARQAAGVSAPVTVTLPAGWNSAVDPATGDTYYYHTDGTSQWELPSEPAAAPTPMAIPHEPLMATIPDEPLMATIPDEPLVVIAPEGAAAAPPSSPPSCSEVWLNPAAQDTRSVGEAIQHGEVVLCVPNVAAEPELQALLHAALSACERTGKSGVDGKSRLSVSDRTAFSKETVLACEELILRVLDRVDEQLPSVYATLFEPSAGWVERQALRANGLKHDVMPPEYLAETCPTLRELYMAGELEWSEGEPAINVYEAGGGFGTHKDHMALTILMPLSSPTTFSGGGTGFWSHADEEMYAGKPAGAPTSIIKPPLGTALLFGGDVSHAGMPVERGLRSVFVCSFSTRTSASPEDRIHGLQFAYGASGALRERA